MSFAQRRYSLAMTSSTSCFPAPASPVNDPTDLENIFMRAENGEFVPLSSLASIQEVAVASNLAREQRRRAVPVSAELAEGVPLSDAVADRCRPLPRKSLKEISQSRLLGEAKVLQDSNRRDA